MLQDAVATIHDWVAYDPQEAMTLAVLFIIATVVLSVIRDVTKLLK